MFTLYDDDNDKREIEDIDVVRHEYGGNRFAWDPQKALENEHKHSVSFELASEVFSDPYCITAFDPYPGETRMRIIGETAPDENGWPGPVLFVVYIELLYDEGEDPFYRIISARQAKEKERKQYYDY